VTLRFIPLFLVGLLLAVPFPSHAADETSDQERSFKMQEGEKKLIPEAEVETSTSPLTPISPGTNQPPYEQAKAELIKAFQFSNAGNWEASSDVALEAYEDLLALHRPFRVKKSKLRKEIHEAAAIYIDSSIAFILQGYKDAGKTSEAAEEARARLEDLRDVARNYPELNKKLNNTIDRI